MCVHVISIGSHQRQLTILSAPQQPTTVIDEAAPRVAEAFSLEFRDFVDRCVIPSQLISEARLTLLILPSIHPFIH
jgi:hypothetical protein